MGGRRCLVSVWVVSGSLPLLLNRRSLASLGAVLDVAVGRMAIFALGVTVTLALSSARHLKFNAVTGKGRADAGPAPPPSAASDLAAVLEAVLDKDSVGLDRAVRKLHTQYRHCAAPRLIRLLQDQGVTDTEVFRAVTKATLACDACRRYGPRLSRPLVSVPQSLPFNDLVAMDLAFLSPLGTFLHMIDVGTRFSKGVGRLAKRGDGDGHSGRADGVVGAPRRAPGHPLGLGSGD